MKKIICVLFLAFISLSCQTPSNDIKSIENDLLPNFYIEGEKPEPVTLNERMHHYGVPGLSVAVFKNGELEWAKGYGMADLETQRPVDEQTLFQAASISKPVSAVAVHKMAEEGVIDLDTDLNTYLSSWKLPENEYTREEKVTLARILNHTAGTTVWGFPGYARTDTIPSAVGVVSGIGNTDPILVYKVPGESWQYSGGGYTVMQIALEDVADQPFADLMEEKVLLPLGMNSSTFEQPLPASLHDRAATGYLQDSTAVEGNWHVYPEQAAAGLWTTPTDLARYAMSMQQSILGEENALLEQNTVQRMLTPGDNEHGLGPGIKYNGTHFGHGGSNEGFRCNFVASMKGGNGVVVMTNSSNGSSMAAELMQAIYRHYGWSGPESTVKKRKDLSLDYIKKFEGRYQIPQLGIITMAVVDSSLVILKGEISQEQAYLAAENDSTFFDIADGTTFKFNFEDSVPAGFEVQGFTATRLKTEEVNE